MTQRTILDQVAPRFVILNGTQAHRLMRPTHALSTHRWCPRHRWHTYGLKQTALSYRLQVSAACLQTAVGWVHSRKHNRHLACSDMARLGLILAAAALLIASCPRHGAAQTWGSSKGTQQVVASSGKGDASMGRTQVVKECDDVCRDECTQDVKTKCEKVPYQEQVCTDRAYSDNTTSCTKKCAVVTPAPAAPAEPVPGNDMPVTTVVGSGKAMYGGKNVAANTRPMVGRKLLGGASLLGTMGRKLKGAKSTKGGGVAYTYVAAQPQVVYAQPQYVVVQQQQPQYTYVAAAQPQYTYVAAPAPQGELVCNDECVTIPILRYANECQLVPKEREACTDYVTTTCKKVCKPECREFTQQVALATGKGR